MNTSGAFQNIRRSMRQFFLYAGIVVLMLVAYGARAEIVDVSGQVEVTKSGLVFNRATGTYDTTVTLKNSLLPMLNPVSLVVTGISPQTVTLANASGTTADGKSYVDVPLDAGVLAPGQSSSKVVLKFKNPNRVSFTFQTEVFANVQTGFTSGTARTSIIGASGGTIELPGVATITVPPDTVQSAAIELAVQDRPEFDTLLANLPDYSSLNLPRLRIKSSAPLNRPIYLKVPISSTQVALGQTVTVLALEESSEDGEAGMVELTSIDASICEKGNAVCATIIPAAFMPVPLDPEDPVINLMLATAPPTANTDALWTVPPSSISPQGLIQPTGTVTFGATLRLMKTFSFAQNTPLMEQPLITSPYLMSRMGVAGKVGKAHKGIDLRSQLPRAIYPVLPGSVESKTNWGTSTQDCDHVGGPPVVPPAIPTIYGVKVAHTGIAATRYLHTQQNPISSAGDVTTQQIATSDTSGTCDPHLHFDVYFPDSVRQIDPRPLLLNDMSLYLLPPDPGDFFARNPGEAFSLVLGLKVDGWIAATYLDNQEWSDFAVVSNPNNATGGTVTALSGSRTVLTFPVDIHNNRGANIEYRSDPIDLQQALVDAAAALIIPMTVDDMLAQKTVTVELEFCTFRLPGCYVMAKWDIFETSELTVILAGWNASVTSVDVTSTPDALKCGPAISNEKECKAQFKLGETVILRANPTTLNREFLWSGDCNGNQPQTTIVMDRDQNCQVLVYRIPEPGTIALMGLGIAGLIIMRRWRRV